METESLILRQFSIDDAEKCFISFGQDAVLRQRRINYITQQREDLVVYSITKDNLTFSKISNFNRGLLCELLEDGYSFDERYKQCFGQDWIEFDNFFFDNLEIADKYGFITLLGDEPIGLVSWDPRNRPEYVAIGHNCIKTKYKGNGYGKIQLNEALNRIKKYDNLKKIIVQTNSNLIAPRNYESVGFKLADRKKNNSKSAFSGDYLNYEIVLN